MSTGDRFLRIYGWGSLVVSAAKLIAGYYALLVASGHVKEWLLQMSALSYLQAAVLALGLLCFAYSLWADGWFA